MIYLGEINRLKIIRSSDEGMVLADKIGSEVLLPKQFVDSHFKQGDLVEIFVYKTSAGNTIATIQEPLILVGEFAYLKVTSLSPEGAFLAWGMDEDLFLPNSELSKPLEVGKAYVVFAYVDEESGKVMASSKINKFIGNHEMDLQVGDEVDLMIFEETFLGYNAIVNNVHKGLVYKNEVYQNLQLGDKLIGYIKKIREDAGLDISLQKIGIMHLADTTQEVLAYLKKNKGILKLTDASTPEEITALLGMSKKAFKRSIGILYKQRMVRIEEDGVYLI